MKNSARILFTLLLAIAWFPSNGFPADEKPRASLNETNGAWQRRIKDVKFDGQPLLQAVENLQKYFPEVNFVVPHNARVIDNVRETFVYATLHNVTLDEILQAIELESEGRIRAVRRENLVAFAVARPVVAAKDQNWPVCRVFSLAPYLAYKSEEEAERAINSLYQVLEYAWEMLGKQVRVVQRPELNIHSGTKLLIAVGGERELAIVEQVIRELQGSAPTRTVAAPAENELKSKTAKESPKPAAGNKQ